MGDVYDSVGSFYSDKKFVIKIYIFVKLHEL